MKTNELNWALFYASLGWSVVPTHHVTIDKSGTKSCSCQQGADCISKGKHPAINWTKHQKERATKQQITEWFDGPYRGYSVGLITGSVSRMFVVDVDEGPGKDGGDTLAQLQLANDDLPPTPIAKTGGGGRHFILKTPPDFEIPTDKNTLGPGIDTRGERGFVVAAPSLHASGEYYIWDDNAHPNTTPVADAPQWVVKLLQQGIKAKPNATPTVREDGLGRVLDGRETYMVRCIASVINHTISNGGALVPEEIFSAAWPRYRDTTLTRDSTQTLEGENRGETLMRQRIDHLLRRVATGKWPAHEEINERAHERLVTAERVGVFAKALAEMAEKPPLTPTFIGDAKESEIPKRRWLYGHHLARKFVSITLSPGAVGKTSLELTGMIAMATNRNLIGDIPHEGAVKTWTLNLEDPHDELLRRVFAICRYYSISPDLIRQTVALDSGRDRSFIIAEDNGNGNIIATPDAEQLVKQIKAHNIACVSIDPFVKSHYANENDNKQIDDIITVYGQVAEETNCAVSLVHHVRKPAPGQTSAAGDVNQARGASALGAAVRSARTVTVMTDQEAQAFGITPERRKWYIRVDDAKTNMQPPQEHAVWLERQSVTLDNGTIDGPGDNMPALALWTPPDPFDGLSSELVQKILDQIEKGPADGVRYSPQSRTQARARSIHLAFDEVLSTDPRAEDKSDAQVTKIVQLWLKAGLLVREKYHNKIERRDQVGLFVDNTKRPGQTSETFI